MLYFFLTKIRKSIEFHSQLARRKFLHAVDESVLIVFVSIAFYRQVLECHLLTLTRCINMKKADNLGSLIDEIERLVRILGKKSKAALFVKPRLSMLEGYLEIVCGRKIAAMRYLRKAAKFAENQSNRLMLAWIAQNEKVRNVDEFRATIKKTESGSLCFFWHIYIFF